MTRELIIEGSPVDLFPDTDITLEYVNDITSEIGKISLSHSYTVKLPKTLRNARILDDPGHAGHESAQTRRFLDARFYRNGVDLLGEAKAYILRTTPDSYEVVLTWNDLEALQVLSQSKETLNDLPDLPVLTWIGPNGATPDYTAEASGGAFFARYNSGLGSHRYPEVNAATHPCMLVENLFRRILDSAGVPFEMSDTAAAALQGAAVLAATGHTPDRAMELESGSVAESVKLVSATVNNKPATLLYLQDWRHGWDAPSGAADVTQIFTTGDNDTHRVLMNLQTAGDADLTDCAIVISGAIIEDNVITSSEELFRAYFSPNGSGWHLYFDEELKLSGWPKYTVNLQFSGSVAETFVPYHADLPLFAVNRVHEAIDISKDNRFPIQGNLPDIGQWDFIKACLAMYGLSPVIRSGKLRILKTAELLETGSSYDWTGKVDMTDRVPQDVSYSLDGWARRNTITFAEDTVLSFDPTASLVVDDTTLEESRELYELPFAASMQGNAQHYKVTDGEDGLEVEDVDIQPRIFFVGLSLEGGRALLFEDFMYGDGLISMRYAALQNVVRRPVRLTERIRLNELDLAGLNLTRPVYLGQYGQYYVILKIQTSDTDLCKVEFLQIS